MRIVNTDWLELIKYRLDRISQNVLHNHAYEEVSIIFETGAPICTTVVVAQFNGRQ
jgi:hypothetical protein